MYKLTIDRNKFEYKFNKSPNDLSLKKKKKEKSSENRNYSSWLAKSTMARQERFVVKAVLLLGLTFLSSVVQGAEPNYSLDFDVTKFGAEANGDKNNAQVINSLKKPCPCVT